MHLVVKVPHSSDGSPFSGWGAMGWGEEVESICWIICMNMYASFQGLMRYSLFTDGIWVLGFYDAKPAITSSKLNLVKSDCYQYHFCRTFSICLLSEHWAGITQMINNTVCHWTQGALDFLNCFPLFINCHSIKKV